MSPKTGRPTLNPKNKPIHVRLDQECEEILRIYCSEQGISRAEGVRHGIRKLKKSTKK